MVADWGLTLHLIWTANSAPASSVTEKLKPALEPPIISDFVLNEQELCWFVWCLSSVGLLVVFRFLVFKREPPNWHHWIFSLLYQIRDVFLHLRANPCVCMFFVLYVQQASSLCCPHTAVRFLFFFFYIFPWLTHKSEYLTAQMGILMTTEYNWIHR